MKEVKLGEYREDVEKLLKYLPWLEQKAGNIVSRIYDEDGLSGTTISFPVYDSTLMNFINEATASGLMDDNYHYAYSRNSIHNVADEKAAIERATVADSEVLTGILSRYVLGGRTKGTLWSEGVSEGIFLLILKKMKKLLEIWDAPLA
ncbi:MAG: DUF6508 domain-containing protein [Lachnospiraceae bacterium]|nr:DUF6508 domain-containing protein [Lachnospiraceae bacterium]